MLHRIRAAVRRLRGKRPSAKRDHPSGYQCGYLDCQDNGWFQSETGHLFTDFRIRREDTVVDVGCGDGGASVFAASTGAEVIAVDIDAEMTKIAEKKLRKSRARTFRTVVSDSNPLPLPEESASRVVAMEVMEHVDDPPQFLSELVRIGDPQALFLITVPDAVSERVQKGIAPDCCWQKPHHIHIFERDELDGLVHSAGLEIINRSHKSFFWAMWWTLFWAADQELGEPEGSLLSSWAQTWHELMKLEKGQKVRKTLDAFMPKSQVIVARKAA
ncbi:MAG: class I SAM-dependent methyltransferase [Pirellulaceae bacterium]